MRNLAFIFLTTSLVVGCGGGSNSEESTNQHGSIRISGAPFGKDRLDACKAYLNESEGSMVGQDVQTYITLEGCNDDPTQSIKVYQVTYTNPNKSPYLSITYSIAKYASSGNYNAIYDDTWDSGEPAPIQVDKQARTITFSNLPLPLDEWGGSLPKPTGSISIDGQLRY